jgi:hypothetical protein
VIGLIGLSKDRAPTQTMRWKIFIFQSIISSGWI